MNLSSSRPLAACLALVLTWLALGASSRAASVPAPDFELQRWETGEKIRLADFAGQIAALDFFAYWCGPCQRASAGVESGIQKHYAGREGNPQGVPVRVVAVNIERDHPKLTAQLIQRAGLELVANDFDGALLAKFDGAGTPFLVVIDNSQATRETSDFRAVIDTVQPPPPPPRPALRVLVPAPERPHQPRAGFHQLH